MHIKLVQSVNNTTAPLSTACTFTSLGVHKNVKLQPTTIAFSCVTPSPTQPDPTVGLQY